MWYSGYTGAVTLSTAGIQSVLSLNKINKTRTRSLQKPTITTTLRSLPDVLALVVFPQYQLNFLSIVPSLSAEPRE
ncbi:hypothetical protein L3X38_001873 [Prunus dulcis]|uniref:Uncharacterized protein n=1 Tax=Prunus dulcis TaxID=3755 RepID=A0AAD4WTH6_PRUDU|nr:hypothetical protein L3X38_001873 [Prunus dulcis]